MADFITREVYKINQSTGAKTYAGYAKFDNNGRMIETRGGYGPQRRGIREDRTGNARTNDKSMVQNNVNLAGANGAKRNPQMRNR